MFAKHDGSSGKMIPPADVSESHTNVVRFFSWQATGNAHILALCGIAERSPNETELAKSKYGLWNVVDFDELELKV